MEGDPDVHPQGQRRTGRIRLSWIHPRGHGKACAPNAASALAMAIAAGVEETSVELRESVPPLVKRQAIQSFPPPLFPCIPFHGRWHGAGC